jgi:ribosomal protein S18 acetylase RimI-like enzyme
MSALACRFPAGSLSVFDLPYRLSSWALDDPDNACLWFDEDRQLVAWAVLQSPFRAVDYAFHPAVEASLYPEFLAWADRRARAALGTAFGRPSWYVNVFAGQAQRIRHLEAAGFACQADVGEDSWSKVLMRRSLPDPVKEYLPPAGCAGATVRPLAGENEAAAYVELHRSVFESKNMTVPWRLRILRHPAYRPDLDLIVAAPDGRLAAFCVCWLSENSREAQVEPLGCHQDFRRYALGRVALSQALLRLQALGVQHIYVETDSYRSTAFRLYESFGFQVIQDVLVYRKDYGEMQN